MPADLIASFADRSGESEEEVERLWNKAKDIVKDEYEDVEEGSDEFYQIVVDILKNMLGLESRRRSPHGHINIRDTRLHFRRRSSRMPRERRSRQPGERRERSGDVSMNRSRRSKAARIHRIIREMSRRFPEDKKKYGNPGNKRKKKEGNPQHYRDNPGHYLEPSLQYAVTLYYQGDAAEALMDLEEYVGPVPGPTSTERLDMDVVQIEIPIFGDQLEDLVDVIRDEPRFHEEVQVFDPEAGVLVADDLEQLIRWLRS